MSATAVRRAIYGSLTSNGSLIAQLGPAASGYAQAIYHDDAPQDAQYPFVIFSKSSGVPTEAFSANGASALENDIWMIKAVDRNSTADQAEAIADLVKTQLNDRTLSISGGICLYLRRQSDIEYTELSEGVQYRHAGSLYRLIYT